MATYKTYEAIGNREDLGNVLFMISPEKTPFISAVGKTTSKNTYHEWQTDALATANADNAAVEGADATSATLTPTVRVGNYNQIMQKTVQVSGTQQHMDSAGRKNELAHQITKGMQELKTDMEASFTSNNASVAGNASTARKSAGFEAWCETNSSYGAGGSAGGFSSGIVAAATDGTQAAITEANFQTVIQNCWTEGGDGSLVITGPGNKARISAFTGTATKTIDMKDQTIRQGVDVYVSDFGRHEIVPSHFSRTRSVLVVDPGHWKISTLRPLEKKELAKAGDSDKYQLLTEVTLESCNEKASGVIADLTD